MFIQGADKSLGRPWKETSYSDQDLQHNSTNIFLLFVRHKSWYSVVSLGRCRLFLSRAGLVAYQHPVVFISVSLVSSCYYLLRLVKEKFFNLSLKNFMVQLMHEYIIRRLLTYLLNYLITHSLTHSLTHPLTHLLTYLLTYLLHGVESFFRS